MTIYIIIIFIKKWLTIVIKIIRISINNVIIVSAVGVVICHLTLPLGERRWERMKAVR